MIFNGQKSNELNSFECFGDDCNFLKITENFNQLLDFRDEYNKSTKNLTFDIWGTYQKYEPFSYELDYYYNLPFIIFPDNINNITDIFFYSCRLKNYIWKYDTSYKESNLEIAIIVITLLTLIILIIFYYSYKKAISLDKKVFQKNKFFINNYTLVLHKLKINSDDFNQELSDLIFFLNDIIKNDKHLFLTYHENYKEIADLNIFDISISNVNEKKIKVFEKIKSLKNKINDILNDNDSIKNKVKTNIREIYLSMHNIAVNLSENNEENEEDNKIKENISSEPEDGYDLERQLKVGRTKTLVNENINKITNDIVKMHEEYNLSNYVDIYITFRNQLIANLIYNIYNKSRISRFFDYIFCQSNKIKKYYYKNKWLNFYFAKENPSDIKWENCYISAGKKCGRRLLSIIISAIFVLLIAIIMVLIKNIEDEYSIILTVMLNQIVNIGSSLILNYLTKFQKYSSKSKEIFSDISKYFWLNFLSNLAVLCKRENFFIFSYLQMEDYFKFSEIIILNMFYSIFLFHLSSIISYIWNLLKRFADSKYNNGKTTELKDKTKYEELYLGPEFPFEERYGQILVNLSICLLFGTNSPVIYFFFVSFLIVTLIVVKFFMIYYYRKPPLYGSLLSKKTLNYFILALLIYVYGVVYNLSNPYIFNNSTLKLTSQYKRFYYLDMREIFGDLYCLMNPLSLIYLIVCIVLDIKEISFLFYNFNSNIVLAHILIFIVLFFNPKSFIKKKLSPKRNTLSFLNISPIEIGRIYSVENLKKYYEIKKLQLFNLIIDCNNSDKRIDIYSHLINNYMNVIKYIKQNIENKNEKQRQINDIPLEVIMAEDSPLKREINIKDNQIQITGDISYNQSFINKYEIYSNFCLMKNI